MNKIVGVNFIPMAGVTGLQFELEDKKVINIDCNILHKADVFYISDYQGYATKPAGFTIEELMEAVHKLRKGTL